MARQLLSTQQHYDWGLRSIKAVLTTAGQLFRAAAAAAATSSTSDTPTNPNAPSQHPTGDPGASQNPQQQQQPPATAAQEASMLLHAIRTATIPKLLDHDVPRFEQLLHDVFPNTPPLVDGAQEVLQAVRAAMSDMRLQVIDSQVQRVLQLHVACRQRMGVIIMGPPASGKSTLWRVLQRAYGGLGRQTHVRVFNPKSVPRQQLLGHLDADTREWSDGILTAAVRAAAREGRVFGGGGSGG